MTSTIHEQLVAILVDDLFVEVDSSKIGPDDNLRTIAGLDSIGFLELRVQCEDRFGVDIADGEFSPENFQTLGRLAALIEELRRQSS